MGYTRSRLTQSRSSSNSICPANNNNPGIGIYRALSAPQSSDDQVTEALRLHAHVEKRYLVVFATAAKSVDIVQAQIVCFLFSPSLYLVLTAKALVSMEYFTQDSPG